MNKWILGQGFRGSLFKRVFKPIYVPKNTYYNIINCSYYTNFSICVEFGKGYGCETKFFNDYESADDYLTLAQNGYAVSVGGRKSTDAYYVKYLIKSE